MFQQHDPPSLKKMRNENVLLSLPGELKVSDIRWIAIWCRRFTVNYGHVIIPTDIEYPNKVVSTFEHVSRISVASSTLGEP
jgi:hypothetical protein